MAANIYSGRFTAKVDQDFVVFLIGMRINNFWTFRKWWPVSMAMGPIVRTLYENPEKGFFGAENFFNGRTSLMLSYWDSFESLDRFARNPSDPHLESWKAFRGAVGDGGTVGIWHETYQVKAESYESVYGNMPRFGLANAFEHIPVTQATKSARQRIGRKLNTEAEKS